MTSQKRAPVTPISSEITNHELPGLKPLGCTCHPDDNPPRPCPRLFALRECQTEQLRRVLSEAADAAHLILAYERRGPEMEVICERARWIIRIVKKALEDYPSPPAAKLTSAALIALGNQHSDAVRKGPR